MRVNVLISSVGRRVELIECFRRSLANLSLDGSVFGIDCSRRSPAFHLVNKAWTVPRCSSDQFVPCVMEICQREKVGLLVPTIDTELAVYAASREDFAGIKTNVAVSSPETVAIGADKVETNRLLIRSGIPTVRQATVGDVLASPTGWEFPVIAKPRHGSGSKGVLHVDSLEGLRAIAGGLGDYVVEETANGREFTINVFVDGSGICRCAVPHERLEVRAGEVSKGRTLKNRGLLDIAKKVAESLPGAYGALNMQGFMGSDDFRLFEINPRFGGGYPLAHQAGAEFTRWLLEDALGLESTARFDEWRDGLVMLRYDRSVFIGDTEL